MCVCASSAACSPVIAPLVRLASYSEMKNTLIRFPLPFCATPHHASPPGSQSGTCSYTKHVHPKCAHLSHVLRLSCVCANQPADKHPAQITNVTVPCTFLSCARSLLTGILPGAALRLLLAVAPGALAAGVRRARGAVSVGGVDGQVTTLFFVFQVLYIGVYVYIYRIHT